MIGTQTVDSRVVQISFDNKDFESRVKESLNTLETLNKSLDYSGAPSGMQSLASSVQEVHNQFSMLDIVAATALSNITNSAINAGKSLVNSIVSPLTSGGLQRALNFEQAEFMFTGLGLTKKQIGDATKGTTVMGRAYKAVEGTLYSLDNAAKVSAQLMASGIDPMSEKMTKHLRAIAGVASMTNSDFASMGEIFTTAASNGKIMTQQMRQLSSRGLNGFAALAKHFNVTEAAVTDMVSKGKVSFEEFSDAMYESFGEMAGRSKETFNGALEDMKAAASRIGEKIYTPLLESARDYYNAMVPLLDSINNRVTPYIETAAKLIDRVIDKVVVGVDLLSAAFDFDETTNQLKALVKAGLATEDRVKNLKKYKKVIDTLAKAINSFGRAINFIVDIAKKIIKLKFDVFLQVAKKAGDILSKAIDKIDAATSKLPDISDKITNAIEKFTEKLKDLFNTVKKSNLINRIGDVFRKAFESIPNILHGTNKSLIDLARTASTLVDIFSDTVIRQINKFVDALGGIAGLKDVIGLKIFWDLSRGIANLSSATQGGWNAFEFLDRLTKNANIANVFTQIGKASIVAKGAFLDVQKALELWQHTLKADVLLKLAKAVALLSVSLWLLSTIDAGKLIESAVAVGFLGQLMNKSLRLMMSAMMLVSTNWRAIAALPAMASALIGFGTSIMLLAVSMKIVASIDPEQMATSLFAIGTLIAIMVGVAREMAKLSALGFKSGSLIPMAASMIILAAAMKIVASIEPERMVSSLLVIGTLIALMVGVAREMSKLAGFNFKSGMLLVMAASIAILAFAFKQLATLKFEQVMIGIISLMSIMFMMEAIMSSLSKMQYLPLASGIMLAFAASMAVLAYVFKQLGQMDIKEINKAILALGSIEFILLTALGLMSLMDNTSLIANAGAMIGIAIALKIMVSSYASLGAMDMHAINRASFAFAVIEGVLVSALALVSRVGGGKKLAVGVLSLVGTAFALIMLANAFIKLGKMGETELETALIALAVIEAGMYSIFALMSTLTADPKTLLAVAGALLIFSVSIGVMAASLMLLTALDQDALFSSVLALSILIAAFGFVAETFEAAAPAMLAVAAALLVFGLAAMAIGGGLILVGYGLTAFSNGIMSVVEMIEGLISRLINGIINFRKGIATSIDQVGYFLLGLAGVIALAEVAAAPLLLLAAAIAAVGVAFILVGVGLISVGTGLSIVSKGFKLLLKTVKWIADNIGGVFTNMAKAIKAASKVLKSTCDNIGETLPGTYKALKKQLKAIAKLNTEAAKAGKAVVDGLIKGLDENKSRAIKAANDLAEETLKAYKKKMGIKSPSREMAKQGKYTVEGLAKGINKNSYLVTGAITKVAQAVQEAADSDLSTQPIITPVVDLTGVNEAAASINSMMTTQQAMSIAASVDSTPSKEEMAASRIIAGINAAVTGSNTSEGQNGGEASVTIEVPLTIDGREFARSTATYTQTELNKLQTRANRQLGVI